MSVRVPEIHIGASRLMAVPAIHFRTPFALVVNRICAAPESRPDAIAVELGNASCQAVASWLADFRVETRDGVRTELPCMLGLTKAVRRIRASKKRKAWELQARLGKSLHEIAPDILREELDYSSASMLCLSPTDSIIEAIRCAVELGISVHGVDLEDSPHAARTGTSLADPLHAHDDLRTYVEGSPRGPTNADYAARARCADIDDRRELAMAARLKGLLAQHRHVLFTGGLAHWNRLRELLLDDGVQAAGIPPVDDEFEGRFTRCVIHPLLAVHHMDLFPLMARRHEAIRYRPEEPTVTDGDRLFQALLRSVYRDYFRGVDEQDGQLKQCFEDWENRTSFEQFLSHLCLLKQMVVPDFGTALEAAEGVMSPGFCRRLAVELMAFDWITPAEYPDLPVLAHVPALRTPGLKAEYRDHRDWRSKAFFVASRPGDSPGALVPVPWEWIPGQRGTPEWYTEEFGRRETAETDESGDVERRPQMAESPPHEPKTSLGDGRDGVPTGNGPDGHEGEAGDTAGSRPNAGPGSGERTGEGDERERDAGTPNGDGPDTQTTDSGTGEGEEETANSVDGGSGDEQTDAGEDIGETQQEDSKQDDGSSPQETGDVDQADEDTGPTGETPELERGAGKQDKGPRPSRPPWEMSEAVADRDPPPHGHPRTWPPTDILHTLMAIRADQIAEAEGRTGEGIVRSERFESGLMDGVDVRSTIRARVRGDWHIYVRDCHYRCSRTRGEGTGPSPTVFVLLPGKPSPPLYIHAGGLSLMEPHVYYPRRLAEVAGSQGRQYVDGLSFVEKGAPSPAQRAVGIKKFRVHGTVAFTQMHFGTVEEARWLEETEFRRCPILNDTSEEGLLRMYRERHGVDLDPTDWPTFLVRAVIPYAAVAVNIVAEDSVTFDPVIYLEARRRNVVLSRMPLSMFPPDWLRKIAIQYHAAPLDEVSGQYPVRVERAMGEPADTNRALLPTVLQSYRHRRRHGVQSTP